jgi:hypothetical protein
LSRPWHRDEDADPPEAPAVAAERLLARTAEEHLRRAAMIATNGANDSASRLQVIEHLLWAMVKTRTDASAASHAPGASDE